jgi:hypothetical protein
MMSRFSIPTGNLLSAKSSGRLPGANLIRILARILARNLA